MYIHGPPLSPFEKQTCGVVAAQRGQMFRKQAVGGPHTTPKAYKSLCGQTSAISGIIPQAHIIGLPPSEPASSYLPTDVFMEDCP